MKVATIQFAPVFRSKKENLQKLALLITEAVNAGATLIVAPELCTTGYTYMSKVAAREDAEVIGDFTDKNSTMSVMRALAAKYNVTLVWGMSSLDVGTGKVYNSQVYLEPTGFYGFYHKINRWGNDFLAFSPGISNPPIFTSEALEHKRIGMLICRDVRDKKNDDWKNFYSPGDADIVCLSTNWGRGGFPAVSWMEFAEDNKVTLIVSNRYGIEGHNDFGEGGVCVITKTGDVQCEGLIWSANCIVYAEV